MAMTAIAWIGPGTPIDTARLGGKGAGLVRLAAAGLPVPSGFVVAPERFDDVVDDLVETHLDGAAMSVAQLEDVSARLRAAVFERSAGRAVLHEVAAAYRRLGGDAPVAVRSSASGEDAPEHSFAGEHDSFLWVAGRDDVLAAVRRCWASLYTARALDYRRTAGGLPTGSMAVVVQRMVPARSAGVFMTLNPSNGDRSKVVIEAVWGLGEPLVSGMVDPDRFVVDKVTGQLVSRHVAHKATLAVRDPSGIGVVTTDVPADQRDAPSLTNDEIAELVACARRIERADGRPQDGEFAVDDAGVQVLQTRPETVWSRRPPEPVTAGRSAMQQILHTIAPGTAHDPDPADDKERA